MHRDKSAVFWLCLLLFPRFALFGADLSPLMLDLKVLGLQQAGPPELLGARVLFTYESDRPVRMVGARFAHEEYRTLHVYSRNQSGVLFLVYDLPAGQRDIRYRIVVDGLWMADPFNPDQETDRFGTAFSRLLLAELPARDPINPQIQADGSIVLRLRTPTGRRVTVAGTFNGWDPFLNALVEVQPGSYEVRLRLLPGVHYYHFWVDGRRLLDPHNMATAVDFDKRPVSTFTVPNHPTAGRTASRR